MFNELRKVGMAEMHAKSAELLKDLQEAQKHLDLALNYLPEISNVRYTLKIMSNIVAKDIVSLEKQLKGIQPPTTGDDYDYSDEVFYEREEEEKEQEIADEEASLYDYDND